MAKSCLPIISSVQTPIGTCVEKNIKLDLEGINALSLKMNETYINPKLSYCSRDNKAYGTCYQHGKGINLNLNSFEDCEVIKEKIVSDQLHVPKECLVAGVMPLNATFEMQPILICPTCKKNDYTGTLKIINEINQTLKAKTGFPLINLSPMGMEQGVKLLSILCPPRYLQLSNL